MKILRRVWGGKVGGSGILMWLTTGKGGGGGEYQASVLSETTAQVLILSYCNCMQVASLTVTIFFAFISSFCGSSIRISYIHNIYPSSCFPKIL